MAAGMKDVATLAGVAVGTVSNVLNHPDLVRPQTRARVEAAMEQLGFIPNASARQLRAGRSRCLGLVVLDVTNPFFTEVARGAEDFAQAEGYAVILCNSDEAEPKERQYLRVLEEQRVRGILITPVHGRAPALHGIRDRGTPVVLLDRPGPAGQCSVAVDDRRGGELAVAHLLALGHRRIALVNGPLAIRQCADRRRGAYQAVVKAGLDPAAVLLEVPVPAMNTRCGADAGDQLRAAVPSVPSAPGAPAAVRVIPGGGAPTAAFCTNDLLALGLLRRLGQLGAQVPGDVAIVGYDDIDFAADSAVPLTSVRQPKYQLGQAGAELLLEEADHPARHEHRRIIFTPELITRASSQPETAAAPLPGGLPALYAVLGARYGWACLANSPSRIASLTQQLLSSARCTLSFSLCARLSGSDTPVSSSSAWGKVPASAATTGSEPPLPAATGEHPQVWAHAARKASKAPPDASIRCGLPSFAKVIVTSAPQGARPRICASMAFLAVAVSSPGASRTLIFARAIGTSLFAASVMDGASIPRTARAGRPHSRCASVPVPSSETPGRTLANRRMSASRTSMP